MQNFPDPVTILEMGSGAGSSLLAETHDMHCVEHNKDWVDKYDNITYYYAPIVDGWYDRSVLERLPSEYEVLLIDGPPGNIGRSGILEYIKDLGEGKTIIVDDTHRSDETRLVKEIEKALDGVAASRIKDGNKSFVIIR